MNDSLFFKNLSGYENTTKQELNQHWQRASKNATNLLIKHTKNRKP